jgi:hypothetical protein
MKLPFTIKGQIAYVNGNGRGWHELPYYICTRDEDEGGEMLGSNGQFVLWRAGFDQHFATEAQAVAFAAQYGDNLDPALLAKQKEERQARLAEAGWDC